MTRISDLGEDALVALFAPRLPAADAAVLGPGDDAAVLAVDGHLVVSSDVLVDGVHFRHEWSSGADVGWRAAMQNLADIDAMGAVPIALQVTLAATGETDVDWVLDFADGLREACEPHGVGVVGGDLSAAEITVVSVTVIGETHGLEPVTRDGALAGHVVAVSGPLGAARAGFAQLDAGVRIDEETVRLFVRPQPVIGTGIEAALRGATALMDISDGLLRDAARMARASDVRIDIDTAGVPVHPGVEVVATELGASAMEWALTGGEDHRMLAAFPSAAPQGWHVVGEVTQGSGVWVNGKLPEAFGWDHFQ